MATALAVDSFSCLFKVLLDMIICVLSVCLHGYHLKRATFVGIIVRMWE